MGAREGLASCRTALEMIADVSSEDVVKKIAIRAIESVRVAAEEEAARRAKAAAHKRIVRGSQLTSADGRGHSTKSADISEKGEGGEGGGVGLNQGDQRDSVLTNSLSLSGRLQEGSADTSGRELTSADAEPVPATQKYREAYQRGINKATRKPYAMPRQAEGELHQSIKTHAGQLRGDTLLGWIETRAEQFAKFVLALPEGESKFWSELSPRGFLRWLNRPEQAQASRPTVGPAVIEERRRREAMYAEAQRDKAPPPADFMASLREKKGAA